MGIRSRLAKVFGNGEHKPQAMAVGELASGMDPSGPFSPGQPVGPFDGYSRTPRSKDFVTGYNVATRPRTHERVAFDTLRGMVEAYDVAQMCIWHRIDSIRSLDWSLVAANEHVADVSDEVAVGMAALKKPDRDTPFEGWLAQWLYDILAFDAGTLYRMRNRGGRAIGLRPVDGTTIAPLLDYWGNVPAEPAEAYVQYVNGLPWNWLTRSDLIYAPFRKRPSSPYGVAPLETILLNANTDLRFQAYFLQRFTEGNIPAAFASAPETWTPGQIEEFQTYWDAFMLADQAVKSQIKWIPGGSRMEWSNEKDFNDHFSLHLLRKTAAAYHVVPADLGFTENVNRSAGESQADVQHRVGDLPLIKYVQGILSAFLQDDLGLPLRFAFDLGEEQADRLQQAQADKIYVELGAISATDIREMRYGLTEPEGVPVPRFVFTNRSGPIPLASLYAVAGQVDPATAAPAPGVALPHDVFGGAEGAAPNPPIRVEPLAEQIYGPSAMPPAPPPQPPAPAESVTKDAAPAGTTSGVTTETGIVGYDGPGHRDDDDDEDEDAPPQEDLVKRELTAFRRFRQARRRAGTWRDFEFHQVNKTQAHNLNDAGRLAVRKALGEIAVAGLAIRAADTGRVLMLQRGLDEGDPAAGTWEFPGGHLEGDETPLLGAWREWAEETGCIPPPGEQTGSWTNGIYQGIVWTVPNETAVPVCGDRDLVTNPDDPDGDSVESIAWWDPDQLSGNSAVRPELLDSLDIVLAALQPSDAPEIGQMSDISDDLAKAGGETPKGPTAEDDATDWPAWEVDQRLAAVWAPRIRQAIAAVLSGETARRIAGAWLNEPHAGQSAAAWLAQTEPGLAGQITGSLEPVLVSLWTTGWGVGSVASHAVMRGHTTVDWEQFSRVTKAKGGSPTSAVDPSLMVFDRQSLEDWLAHYGVSDISSISGTRMDELAAALEQALEDGASADELASDIEALGADEAAADMMAITEISRAVSQAALANYDATGVSEINWLIAPDDRVCERCHQNEGASPIRLGDTWPSGSDGPPTHPRCRCSVVPADSSGIDLPSIEDLKNILGV